MARILPTAKTRFSIGAATAATADLAQFTADLSYELVDGVKNIGGFGDTFQLVTSEQVTEARTKKIKGTANAGTLELTCDRVPADPGQLAMIAAAQSEDRFNLKVEVPAGGGLFEVNYLTVYIMSRRKNFGGPNSVQEILFTCELDEAPIEVAPA